MRLSDKVVKDWFIDLCFEKKIQVEYWDLTEIFSPSVIEYGSKTASYVKIIKNYKELCQQLLINSESATKYIVLISYDGLSVDLYRILSKFKNPIYFFLWGGMPISSATVMQRVLGAITNPLYAAGFLWGKLRASLYKKIGLIRPYDVVFFAGNQGNEFVKNSAIKGIEINFSDYDNFLNTKFHDPLINHKYVVFLDINLPNQSDLSITNRSYIDSRTYLRSLNSLFTFIESKYGLKVVIAAHPKSNYTEEDFDRRMIIQGKTPQLVSGCEFVLTHHSLSISYAVLNKKPAVFIYTQEMLDLYKNKEIKYIEDISSYLGSNIYNIDSLSDMKNFVISNVDINLYNKFKYSYLTSPASEAEHSGSIFLEGIS
ncbi:hypothetical protein G6676_01730 [Polynucleobacter paneuropaeus]|nr:hypothetical protein G6676_01730 [Polynucleobacter paneuropaeus]